MNKTTKKTLIFGLVIIILLIAILAVLYIPRIIIKNQLEKDYGKLPKYTEVKLNDNYNGLSKQMEVRGIMLTVPAQEAKEHSSDDDSTLIIADDYIIIVMRKRGEALNENILNDEEAKKRSLGADSINEYLIKVMDVKYNDISILNLSKSISEIKENYRYYSYKDLILSIIGDRYGKYEKGEYIFLYILGESRSDGGQLIIDVYNIEKNYEWITRIAINGLEKNNKDALSLDIVSHIVKSIEVLDY